jgi:glycosyltransferase involved in cell wall biosynthesis
MTAPPLRLGVLGWTPPPELLHGMHVGYQHAQFLALRENADVVYGQETLARLDELDAVLAFDEHNTLMEIAPRLPQGLRPLLVFITHDYWAHPLHVAQLLDAYERVLVVVRHPDAQRLFSYLLPGVPCIVQRPGVDTTLFKPHDGTKEFDVLLSGSENSDYPVRQRLNRVVREQGERRGWKVLDLTRPEPGTAQREYAPTLAAAKVSPTGTPRGAMPAGKLVMQYVDTSQARTETDDPYYSYARPDVVVKSFAMEGASPRYLESLACKTLLIGDQPPGHDWYADKMVPISLESSDDELGDTIDHWVRADDERERLCEHAYAETLRTETTAARAAELAEIIREHV